MASRLMKWEAVLRICARRRKKFSDRNLPRLDITMFDSTGLAIQDLAIALAAMERADELELATIQL